jgi:hypothetical protein
MGQGPSEDWVRPGEYAPDLEPTKRDLLLSLGVIKIRVENRVHASSIGPTQRTLLHLIQLAGCVHNIKEPVLAPHASKTDLV